MISGSHNCGNINRIWQYLRHRHMILNGACGEISLIFGVARYRKRKIVGVGTDLPFYCCSGWSNLIQEEGEQ